MDFGVVLGKSQILIQMSFLPSILFLPYEIALIVIFDGGNLKDGSWGSTIAAPVWKRIVLRTLRYLRIPPDKAKIRIAKAKFKKEF